MSSFAKKSKAGSQNAFQNASKSKRPFFDQNRAPDPFFKKQPEDRKPDSEMKADKRLRRLDFSESTRPPSGARLRVPSSGELQKMLSSGKVDEAVVLSRVRNLLERMYREGRLYSMTCNAHSDLDTDIDRVMKDIFPLPGYLDQAAFERYIGPDERDMVYKTVREAVMKPHDKDRENLKQGLEAAAATAGEVANDQSGLEAVFGSETHPVFAMLTWSRYSFTKEPYASTAGQNYGLIQSRLQELANNISSQITTDYNLDLDESFVGGWASGGVLHIKSQYVAHPLTVKSKATFIHEAAHLAVPSIIDHVYYGNPGFDTASANAKIANAAHYEELPKRKWGASAYKDTAFIPGTSKSMSPEQQVRAKAVNYFRKAWDSAANVHIMIRDHRIEQLDAQRDGKAYQPSNEMKKRLLELSALMDLTMHTQKPASMNITVLDVVGAESIAREIHFAWDRAKTLSKDELLPQTELLSLLSLSLELFGAWEASSAVDAALRKHGGILGNLKRDRQLLSWLNLYYKKVYP
ncbi:hypothetical protein FGF66_09935 [Chlorobaculum thiosulfatiphilum]|uniref:Uncharacterized protein n=1 Tax=Chlorobaculum thiosulfatiphilum TaxID=115852 RepID=A0A5C4S4Q3_CHLTI|nr:hypothetical protein [Chlorobaculum thiosulfatiphilum]TNJ38218.1 hypothetical protein FGF66_09935 [Chlorobaculum thiosulfatiphilum]